MLVPMLRKMTGPSRAPAVDLAWRYQEFLGWLYQDSGRPDLAWVWTSRAHDLALETADPEAASYLYMRRSNIASDLDDPKQALALADAALRQVPSDSVSVTAVILRQKAHAHAALGESGQCAGAIDQALEIAACTDTASELALYCTPQYLGMEGGACWLTLGQPRRALEVFAQVPDEWSHAAHRDHGLSLARRATAHAAAGNVEEAVDIGILATNAVKITESCRTVRQLRRLRAELHRWRRHPGVCQLAADIASLMGDAA
jgi:tetratricopeptide (TPR) repeat protein